MGDRTGKSHAKNDDVAGVLYQSQGRYLNKHVGLRTRKPPSWNNNGRSKTATPLELMGCFNCDDPNHTLNNCTKPINVAKAAQRRLEYYFKKKKVSAHQVLYELCSQLDTPYTLFGTSVEVSSENQEELEGEDLKPEDETEDEAHKIFFFPRE